MINGRFLFKDENEIKEYAAECEHNFESALADAASGIINSNAKIITICGPTCSGKTTTANKLMKKLEQMGKKVHVLSFDDFYLDRDVIIKNCLERGVPVEYESAITLDLVSLKKVMLEIASENKTVVPKFDFKSGVRSGYIEYNLSNDDVFIFEGIQALYDEVSVLYNSFDHFSIYICVNSSVSFNGNIFDTETIRFLRRAVRDRKHRGTNAQRTYDMWESVRENEDKNIFPNINKADFIIDSCLPYEINVIKGDAYECLTDVDNTSSFYPTSVELLKKFDGIQQISEDIVPADSVLREFID